MVASVDQDPVQVSLLARHAMEGVDVGTDGRDRDQGLRSVHEKLSPRPLDRERLHLATVRREPAILDKTASGEKLECPAIGSAIEWHREIEVPSVDTEGSAGDRHPLRIPGQLELGGRGAELIENEIAVAQDDDLPIRHPPMDPTGHLEDLVGAKVEAMENVSAALDHVPVPGVVDH